MESIFTGIVAKADFLPLLRQLLAEKYSLPEHTIIETVATVDGYLQHLADDLTLVVEYPYVDKMYRNTYYHYYASKLEQYSRSCIRLSFLNNP